MSCSVEESDDSAIIKIPNILQCIVHLLAPPFCFLGRSGKVLFCQLQNITASSKSWWGSGRLGLWNICHLSFAMQISYCKCRMLLRFGNKATGRQHIVYRNVLDSCSGILWCDNLPLPPFSLPSPLPLFPPFLSILSHYATDLWPLQAFCTIGAPVVKCLWKRTPESADALFGKYPLLNHVSCTTN